MEFFKRTWVQVDLDAIGHNYNKIKSMTNAKIMPVIKADGYGHGAVELAREYERLGASYFAVSSYDEAVQLRNAGILTPVLILGYTNMKETENLIKNHITQTVYDVDMAAQMSDIAQKAGQKLRVHIKVDTGMSRLGIYYHDQKTDGNAIDKILAICTMKGLLVEGIFTHFAASDEEDESFTQKQFGLFCDLIDRLAEKGITFTYRHCCNSAAILKFPQMHLDMVRPGIILYGISPDNHPFNDGSFWPALSLYSVAADIRDIHTGDFVSYGRTFQAEEETRLITIPIGYADGFFRKMSGAGQVLISGKKANIIGRICMDQCMADVTGISDINRGDIVTIIGKDGESRIYAEEVADLCGTIGYEIVCAISKRVPRVYKKGGELIHKLTYIV